MEEIWKDIDPLISNGRFGYQVSSHGRVNSIKRVIDHPRKMKYTVPGRMRKPAMNKGGYYTIGFSGKGVTVHRLVALSFIPNPENKPCINHKNGIKTDNRVENLEWCTVQENTIHAVRTGLMKPIIGVNQRCAKLDDMQVKTIKKCLQDGMSHSKLATYFKIGRRAITDINLGKTWKHISL